MKIIIGLYAILVLSAFIIVGYIIALVIAENKDIQEQKRVEDNKAKYRGLLINSIKEFEEISRIKYPNYCKYAEVVSWGNIIDIKPQKLIISKRIEDGILLVECISDDTRCEFYVNTYGKIYLGYEICPIGVYKEIREFTFETEKLL